jgi:hypothetical protein
MSDTSFAGTAQRTFQQALIHELETNYGLLNSRRMLQLLADDVKRLADQFYPLAEHLQPGWVLFTGTKATGGKVRPGQTVADHQSVTIAWPLFTAEDLTQLTSRPITRAWLTEIIVQRMVRMIEYGWNHPAGPVLLTNSDLGWLFNLLQSTVSKLLTKARQQTGKPLLTVGYFFDQGLRPSHKAEVIACYEQGLDEVEIARQTQHSQSSVGVYLRDYQRVKALLTEGLPLERIAWLLNKQRSLVKAYAELAAQYSTPTPSHKTGETLEEPLQ